MRTVGETQELTDCWPSACFHLIAALRGVAGLSPVVRLRAAPGRNTGALVERPYSMDDGRPS
jgi:hypothetical protein